MTFRPHPTKKMEFRELLHFLFGWIPQLVNLLLPSRRRRKPSPPPHEFPRARVAIIGAGVGGCSTACFLRELGGDALDIHVFSNGKIGGRTRVIEFCGHLYEAGASVIHSSNQYLVDFREQFGLSSQLGKNAPTVPFGIFNGRNLILQTGFSSFFNSLKLFWRYGFSLFRLSHTVNSTLKDFCKIYKLQDDGKTFKTVPEMLQAMGGDKFVSLIGMSTEDYFTQQLELRKSLVNELICAALKVNYGQDNKVDAFTALVALAGMQDGSLWCVQGGNKQIPEHALDASKATFHAANITSVTRNESGGKVSYTLGYEDLKPSEREQTSESSEFDIVIMATPLNLSSIKFSQFPEEIYTTAARTPYHRTVATFIKGQINPTLFGYSHCTRDFPQSILTNDTKDSGGADYFNSVSVQIPSEISDQEVPQFCKPLSEEPTRVWKVFSKAPLTTSQKQQLFCQIDQEQEVDWMAYPQYDPPEECPQFVLDGAGFFYINGIEKAASAMEMSAIGAKNVSLLAKEYILACKKSD